MRTPNTFQIGSTTYTTREYCNARGITDNATILKIQWRINTYTRNHTIQQTIEELKRLTLRQEGIRPWQGTQKERTRAIDQRELLKRSEPSDKIERYIATDLGKELYSKTIQSPKNQPNDIKTAITQCAEAIQTVSRLEKELEEAQNDLKRLKTITANLLNGETSDDRAKRFNQ
jgi:hypothetical protein